MRYIGFELETENKPMFHCPFVLTFCIFFEQALPIRPEKVNKCKNLIKSVREVVMVQAWTH